MKKLLIVTLILCSACCEPRPPAKPIKGHISCEWGVLSHAECSFTDIETLELIKTYKVICEDGSSNLVPIEKCIVENK